MKSSKDEAAKLNTVRHSLIILYYDMGMGDQIYILIYPKINVYSKKKKSWYCTHVPEMCTIKVFLVATAIKNIQNGDILMINVTN